MVQQLPLLLLTRAADDCRWRPGVRQSSHYPCVSLSFGLAERARVADSRGGLRLQRTERAERGAAPSVHQREGLSDEKRIRSRSLLSPPSLSLVSVKVFQSRRLLRARARVLSLRPSKGLENNNDDGRSRTSRNVNDPSAGSPTETLLRLLLPLNDQVWSSSRQHRQCRRIAAHQSEDLTKSFNR